MLIYLDKFESIDKNMSNSNIGARKGRNIKDHMFIIYGIINSVLKGNEPCIDIQIYDLIKAFDPCGWKIALTMLLIHLVRK